MAEIFWYITAATLAGVVTGLVGLSAVTAVLLTPAPPYKSESRYTTASQ